MSFSFDFEPKPRRQSVGVDVGGVLVGMAYWYIYAKRAK